MNRTESSASRRFFQSCMPLIIYNNNNNNNLHLLHIYLHIVYTKVNEVVRVACQARCWFIYSLGA